VRLALAYKGAPCRQYALDYFDDETFFELGIERKVPVLELDGALHTDSLTILRHIDELFPAGAALVEGRIDEPAWQALVEWRRAVDNILQRLYAPALPAYVDIGTNEAAVASYKAAVQRRFGLSAEELANDRYAGYEQLERQTRLKALARHLAENSFYMGQPSIADMVLTADLYPLQLLDGVALPIDLLYYLGRVQETCGLRLDEGLLIDL